MEASSCKTALEWLVLWNILACKCAWFKHLIVSWILNWVMTLHQCKRKKFILTRFLPTNMEIMLFKLHMKKGIKNRGKLLLTKLFKLWTFWNSMLKILLSNMSSTFYIKNMMFLLKVFNTTKLQTEIICIWI